MPPSNGIPELNKEIFINKMSCYTDVISSKNRGVKITIEAQLPQCLQVDVLFTQSYFEFLYSEKRIKTRLEPILLLNYCSVTMMSTHYW